MQVLLRKSNEQQDINCTFCGQGFRLYWERTSPAEQDIMRANVIDELRKQHRFDTTHKAHLDTPFTVPEWQGPPQFSGAALLGGLTTMRRVAPAELDRK